METDENRDDGGGRRGRRCCCSAILDTMFGKMIDGDESVPYNDGNDLTGTTNQFIVEAAAVAVGAAAVEEEEEEDEEIHRSLNECGAAPPPPPAAAAATTTGSSSAETFMVDDNDDHFVFDSSVESLETADDISSSSSASTSTSTSEEEEEETLVESLATVDSFWQEERNLWFEEFPFWSHPNLDTMVYAGRRNNHCQKRQISMHTVNEANYNNSKHYTEEDIEWFWIEKKELLSATDFYKRTWVDTFDGVKDMKMFHPERGWVSAVGATCSWSGTINLYKFDDYVGLYLLDLSYPDPITPFETIIKYIILSEGRYDPILDCYRRFNVANWFLWLGDGWPEGHVRLDADYSREDLHSVSFFRQTGSQPYPFVETVIYFQHEKTRDRFESQLDSLFQWPLKSMKELCEEIWDHLVFNRCLEPNIDIERIDRNQMFSFIQIYLDKTSVLDHQRFRSIFHFDDLLDIEKMKMFRRLRWNSDGRLINAVYDPLSLDERDIKIFRCLRRDDDGRLTNGDPLSKQFPILPNQNCIEKLTISSRIDFTRRSFDAIEGLTSLTHLQIMSIPSEQSDFSFPEDTPLRLDNLNVLTLCVEELFNTDLQYNIFRFLFNMQLRDLKEIKIVNPDHYRSEVPVTDQIATISAALECLGVLKVSRYQFILGHNPDSPDDSSANGIATLICSVLPTVSPSTESITFGDRVSRDFRKRTYLDDCISFHMSALTATNLVAGFVRQLEKGAYHRNFGESIGGNLRVLRIWHIYCTNLVRHKQNVLKLLHWFPQLHDFGSANLHHSRCGNGTLSEIHQLLNDQIKYMTKINRPKGGIRSLLSPEMATNVTVRPDLISECPFSLGRQQNNPYPIPLSYWPKVLENNNEDADVLFSALRIRSNFEGIGPAASEVVGGAKLSYWT